LDSRVLVSATGLMTLMVSFSPFVGNFGNSTITMCRDLIL
jgi:hypothetical protein